MKLNGCVTVVAVLACLLSCGSATQQNPLPAWIQHKQQQQPAELLEPELVEKDLDPDHVLLRRDSGGEHDHDHADGELDLHHKEFCVDVSTYQPVVWVERDGEECSTVFVKKCEEVSVNVCADVTETKCQVHPYTECSMGLVPQEFSETKLAGLKFVEKVCETGKKTIPHTKMLPQCRNVTKQNCVTLWETDANGKQVWAGNEACEPVTWQECKLVPKTVSFIVPEITCKDGQELWYHEPTPQTETRMTNTFHCEVRNTTSCVSQTRPDCKTINFQECREVPVTNCSPKPVHVPTQELLHRKKCLLPDEQQAGAAAPAQTGYGAPPPAPAAAPAAQPVYGAPSAAPLPQTKPLYAAPQPSYG